MNLPFRPFETNLDYHQSLKLLQSVINGGEDGELFLERSKSETLALDDGRIKQAGYNSVEGFGLRVVNGTKTGFSHSNELTVQGLKNASESLKVVTRDGQGHLDKSPAQTNRKLYGDTNPLEANGFAEKVNILKEIDAYARDLSNKVVQVSANLATSFQEIEILTPEGRLVRDSRPMSRLGISVIVESGGHREAGFTGQGGRFIAKHLLAPDTWQSLVDEAYRIANVNLEAQVAPAGIKDVVLGPGWPGILLHEAIGHGLEGDFNRKETSAFSGLMGKRIASRGVTVLDDGTLPDKRGSISVDDEGTPSQATTLIEDGILVGYMQDRQNGRLMGTGSTGNGRRQSYAHTPMPRMTNTYMLAGNDNPEDIVSNLKDGIHAVGFGGGQVDITSGKFVFSCVEAYRIQNGQRKEPIKNATLIGDGPSVLKNIQAMGNDMSLDPGIGTCGKDGQWVPVCVGQPSILIGGLTIGGGGS